MIKLNNINKHNNFDIMIDLLILLAIALVYKYTSIVIKYNNKQHKAMKNKDKTYSGDNIYIGYPETVIYSKTTKNGIANIEQQHSFKLKDCDKKFYMYNMKINILEDNFIIGKKDRLIIKYINTNNCTLDIAHDEDINHMIEHKDFGYFLTYIAIIMICTLFGGILIYNDIITGYTFWKLGLVFMSTLVASMLNTIEFNYK